MATLDENNPSKQTHRHWSIENEIKLFSLLCDYKPAGKNKQHNIKIIINNINESLDSKEEPFSEYDVWNKLRSLYDLEKIDQIEELLTENTSTEETTNQVLSGSANITKDTKNAKTTLDAKEPIQDKKEMDKEKSESSSLSTPEPPQRRTRSARDTTKSKRNLRDTPKEKSQYNDEEITLGGAEKSKVEVSSTSDHTDDQSPTPGSTKKGLDEQTNDDMSDIEDVDKDKGDETIAKIKKENTSEQEEDKNKKQTEEEAEEEEEEGDHVSGDERESKNKDTSEDEDGEDNEDQDEDDVEVIEDSHTDKENESSSEESSPEPMTKRTRQRTRSTHEKTEHTSPNIKKRTRQSVKFDDKPAEPSDTSSRKRRAPPGSVSPPHPPKTRRRTRSVTHEIEEEDASTQSADDAEPEIIKVETRHTTRRSSRILMEPSSSTPNVRVRRSSRKR